MSDHSRRTSLLLHSLRSGGIALVLVVTSVGAAHPGSASETARERADGRIGLAAAVSLSAVPKPVATPIAQARAALAAAKVQVQKHQNVKAVASLTTLRINVAKAHQAGMAQIGKPPADPESDDPPGPPSVIAVLNMEHAVGNGVVAMFNGTKKHTVLHALRDTLYGTHVTRDKMLHRVIALPPEGAGADYSDDMSDTTGLYANEVNVVTAALKTYVLTPGGRVGLTNALTRVRATKATFDKAFGGGE